MQMRAVGVKDGKGPAANLFIEDSVQKPVAQESNVLVKVHAFGLNRMDIMQREGKYPVPPQAGPILGVEFSGIVESVGDQVSDFKAGDKVFGLAYGGAYAEYIVNPSRMCIHMPEEISFEQAAGLPEVWFTAIQALYLVGGLQANTGERVLIHAGASGVGLAAIQLAKAAGCKHIFATASSEKKLDLCRQAGATRAINYKKQKFNEVLLYSMRPSY